MDGPSNNAAVPESSGAGDPPIHGDWHPKFHGVVEAFRDNFKRGDDLGASFAATLEGELIVDIWGGWLDEDCTIEWARDTIVNTYSTTKGVTALAAHLLLDQDAIALDQPVSDIWPEFSTTGKSEISIRHVLGHLAGLPWVPGAESVDNALDWDVMCALLEGATPIYAPGTRTVYHAMTFGHLLGEPIRRVTGEDFSTFVQKRISEPLGADFHIGLREEDIHRVANLIPASGRLRGAQGFPPGKALDQRTLGGATLVNSRAWRKAVLPSANGHGNARAVALIYAPLANAGEPLVSASAVDLMRTRQLPGGLSGPRQAKVGWARAWACGFQPNWTFGPFGPNPRAFGHTGSGGSFGAADPESRLSFSYVMNRLGDWGDSDDRGPSLVRALYAGLRAA